MPDLVGNPKDRFSHNEAFIVFEYLQHTFSWRTDINMSLVVRKTVFRVSDQVRHTPGCSATEDGYRLEILDLGSNGNVLSV